MAPTTGRTGADPHGAPAFAVLVRPIASPHPHDVRAAAPRSATGCPRGWVAPGRLGAPDRDSRSSAPGPVLVEWLGTSGKGEGRVSTELLTPPVVASDGSSQVRRGRSRSLV